MNSPCITVLGINFINATAEYVVEKVKGGGLLVVPAAPGLINIETDSEYYTSLRNADFVIPDSAYMTILWNLTSKKKLNRISGLKFLTTFFNDKEIKNTTSFFLVNPSTVEEECNNQYLKKNGFRFDETNSYVAPYYNKPVVEDELLLKKIESKKPKFIIINLGGGVQEKLGIYLKKNLSYKPAIICTGAAIAFLTGKQADIPSWADRIYIGWLLRCLRNPKRFFPRYLKAFKLATIMYRYGKRNAHTQSILN